MIACVGIGMFTGFIFLMVLLFVSGGQAAVDTVIASPAGPLLQIFVRIRSTLPRLPFPADVTRFTVHGDFVPRWCSLPVDLPPRLHRLRHNRHHDHVKPHDVRLCARPRTAGVQGIRKGQPEARCTA